MNILNKTKTYLVGHMQYGDGSSWREYFTELLGHINVTVFDPYNKPFVECIKEDKETMNQLKVAMDNGEFSKVRKHMKQIRALDLSMVDRCDFLIAYINPEIVTYGTTEEISWATRMRKPVFTVIEGGITKTPFWLTAMIPERQFFNDFDELWSHLQDIDSGLEPIDSKYWRLLRKEYR